MESKVVASSDLSGLCELLVDMAGDWELLLSAIGVGSDKRRQLRLQHQDPKLCLVEGLEQWLVTTETPTYGTIIRALRGKTATNLPLATLVEEFGSKKTTTLVVLPEPCCSVSEATQQSSATTSTDPPVVVEVPQSETSEAKVIPPPAADSSSSSSSAAVATKERPSFPHLPTAALSEGQKSALRVRLRNECGDVQTQFAMVVVKITESLKNRIELSSLVCFLLECPLTQHRKGAQSSYENHLNNAKSVYDVFNVIRPFYSFFGYSLIKAIITAFGTEDDKQRLAEYESLLKAFCKRRVYECPIDALGRKSKDDFVLVVKLKDELEKYTLDAVDEFSSKLCEVFGLPDGVLQFVGAEEGCVELHFAAASSLELVIFPLSVRQRERLRGEGVLELRGGGHHCSLEEGGESEQGPPLEAGIGEAADCGDTARVTALLERGEPVDSRSGEYGESPLMLAARGGHTATVEALLAHGADINFKDDIGWTPLMEAADNGRTATVQSLVAAGADMNNQDNDGRTPLMRAALHGDTATLQSLVGAGAGMNIQDNDGWTALYWAALDDHTAVVEVLGAAGADMNIGDKYGLTPLMRAATSGHTATVQSLAAAGAGMNIQDEDGSTALTVALQRGEFEVAEVLIKAGAGLSHQEKATGWTALFFAAKEGHLPSVRLLLEGGADPTHKDKEGVTAFDVAETYGHQSVMEELEKHSPAAATEAVSEEPQPTAAATARPVPSSSSSSSQPAPTDPSTGAQRPTSPASSSAPPPPPPPPADDPQRTTVRDRVFQAVRILAERFQRLALAGRAKKRAEEEGRREGARPRQRSNKPGWWKRADRQQTESAESRTIRNISSS